MKKLLLTAVLLTTFTATANECKDIGIKAKAIMEWRQNRPDIFEVLPKFPDDKEMVLDAYQHERIDTMAALQDAITHSRSALYSSKNDDATARQAAIVDAFRMKYIAACLEKL